jgi:glycosyltransferase involved in cell wall biosynthesis
VNLKYIHFIHWVNRAFRKVFTYNNYYFYNVFDFGYFLNHKLILKTYPKPDIIILYWVTGFLSTKDIEALKKNTGATIYWYLMDMAPITGGCHYLGSCERFYQGCQNCPAFKVKLFKTIAQNNLKAKSAVFKDSIDGFISASKTLSIDINRSKVGKDKMIFEKYVAVNESIFKPRNKSLSQGHFNHFTEKIVLFSGARSLKEERKGFHYVLEALEYLVTYHNAVSKDILLLLAGSIDEKDATLIPVEYHSLGYLNIENLALAYNLSDFFINSTIEDAGPMMVNQSLMSGIPVISFPVGVAKDLVKDGITGFITQNIDAKELALKILDAYNLSTSQLTIMSQNARRESIDKFGHDKSKKILFSLINN